MAKKFSIPEIAEKLHKVVDLFNDKLKHLAFLVGYVKQIKHIIDLYKKHESKECLTDLLSLITQITSEVTNPVVLSEIKDLEIEIKKLISLHPEEN